MTIQTQITAINKEIELQQSELQQMQNMIVLLQKQIKEKANKVSEMKIQENLLQIELEIQETKFEINYYFKKYEIKNFKVSFENDVYLITIENKEYQIKEVGNIYYYNDETSENIFDFLAKIKEDFETTKIKNFTIFFTILNNGVKHNRTKEIQANNKENAEALFWERRTGNEYGIEIVDISVID